MEPADRSANDDQHDLDDLRRAVKILESMRTAVWLLLAAVVALLVVVYVGFDNMTPT